MLILIGDRRAFKSGTRIRQPQRQRVKARQTIQLASISLTNNFLYCFHPEVEVGNIALQPVQAQSLRIDWGFGKRRGVLLHVGL